MLTHRDVPFENLHYTHERLSSVDFPEPFGPTTDTTLPGVASIVMSLTMGARRTRAESVGAEHQSLLC